MLALVGALGSGLAAAAPTVEVVDVARGGLPSALAPVDGANLVLVYGSEQDGVLGPCGCVDHPRGGLGGFSTYVEAVRAASPGRVLAVDVGGFLSSAADSDGDDLTAYAQARNALFHQAMDLVAFDAWNVGYRDLPGSEGFVHEGLVSATHGLASGASPVIPASLRFERDGLRIGVTGASRRGLVDLQPTGVVTADVRGGVERAVASLGDVDVVVVLLYDSPRDAEPIGQIPGVDVVIEAGGYRERWPPRVVGDAVWVRSRAEGGWIGELRLWVDAGRVVRAVDRSVSVDDHLPVARPIGRLVRAQDAL